MFPTKFQFKLLMGLKCEKLTDDWRRKTENGRQVMEKAHIAFGKPKVS